MKSTRCRFAADGSTLFSGEGFSRRRFLTIAGTGVVASYFSSSEFLAPQLLYAAGGVAPQLRNTARNCIFVFLSGGPSQSDTWDLKEGPWTPAAFHPTSYGSIRWPQGLLPKMAEHLDKLAIIRTALAWAAVHPLAQTWMQISRNPSTEAGAFAPHIGAVVALEMEKDRRIHDALPSFISLGTTMAGAGYLPGRNAPFSLRSNTLPLSHPDGAERLSGRWRKLRATDPDRLTGVRGKEAADMADHYERAVAMTSAPGLSQIFTIADTDRQRYGRTDGFNWVGDGLAESVILARNVIASNRGARFVQITHHGWDHHTEIYEPRRSSLFSQCNPLDNAVGALLTDLSSAPGAQNGKTLLDETLVVILGEFGRKAGPPQNGGRDHDLRMAILMAGGGVRGGRSIGATDALGEKVIDYGWSAQRFVRPEDVTATIYSALGIDYTTVRPDDPLGAGFEYVPHAREGAYQPIEELF